jgi:hypothetical protein
MSASPDTFRALRPEGHIAGQSDGWFYERSTGRTVLLKADVVEAVPAGVNTCSVFDDFLGIAINLTDPLAFSTVVVGAGGPDATLKDDAKNGVLLFTLDNDSEAEELALSFGDQLSINSNDKPIFTVRVKIPTAITTAQFAHFGFASASAAAVPDNVANNAWIGLKASMVVVLESDDATTDTDDKAPDTALTLTADTYYEFKIDMTNPLLVTFWYRATLGGAWTEIKKTGQAFIFGANIACQPWAQLGKSTGTTTPTMEIDYAHVTWNRAAT